MLKEENVQLTLRVNTFETTPTNAHQHRINDLEQTILTLRGTDVSTYFNLCGIIDISDTLKIFPPRLQGTQSPLRMRLLGNTPIYRSCVQNCSRFFSFTVKNMLDFECN